MGVERGAVADRNWSARRRKGRGGAGSPRSARSGRQVVHTVGRHTGGGQRNTDSSIQGALLQRATNFRDENTSEPADYDSFKSVVATGFARAWWCGSPSCEDQVKADTQATTRCMPQDQPGGEWKVHRMRRIGKGDYGFCAERIKKYQCGRVLASGNCTCDAVRIILLRNLSE